MAACSTAGKLDLTEESGLAALAASLSAAFQNLTASDVGPSRSYGDAEAYHDDLHWFETLSRDLGATKGTFESSLSYKISDFSFAFADLYHFPQLALFLIQPADGLLEKYREVPIARILHYPLIEELASLCRVYSDWVRGLDSEMVHKLASFPQGPHQLAFQCLCERCFPEPRLRGRPKGSGYADHITDAAELALEIFYDNGGHPYDASKEAIQNFQLCSPNNPPASGVPFIFAAPGERQEENAIKRVREELARLQNDGVWRGKDDFFDAECPDDENKVGGVTVNPGAPTEG